MSIGEIISGVLKPVASVFNKRSERKQNQDSIKGKLAQSKQDDATKVELTDAEWETVNQALQGQSWKDEYATVSIISIVNAIVIGGVLSAFGYPELIDGMVIALKTLAELGLEIGFLITAVVLAAIGMKVWRL